MSQPVNKTLLSSRNRIALRRQPGFFLVPVALCILILSSCVDTKKAVYFDTDRNNAYQKIDPPESVIKPNDLLNITVSSLSASASSAYNSPNYTVSNLGNPETGGYTDTKITGYLVDRDGRIDFPVLGSLKVSDLTERQIKENIAGMLKEKKLLIDPIVSVRQLNFKVTVLGEVNHPQVITVPSEKITLFEALGFAGDITLYGKKTNVMVIRDSADHKVTHYLNLNSTDIFQSPYYNLLSNDVVYVQPNKARVASTTRTNQALPVIFAALSFAAIVVDRIVR